MTLHDLGLLWPPGEDEMARRIREHAWGATPLGVIESWPERLRFAVEMMLTDPRPTSLAVGEGRTFLFNDTAARLYGSRAPGLLGLSLPQAFPSYPEVADLYDRAFAGDPGEVRAMPLAVTEEGSGEFDATLLPVGDGAGGVLAVLVTSVEVGARLRTEAALRESEAKYRRLFESIDEGFVTAELVRDAQGRPVDALYLEGNPAASRLTGVSDFDRRPWSEAMPGGEAYWLEIYDRVLRTGIAERLERYAAPLGRWYDFQVMPMADADGEPQEPRDSAPKVPGRVAILFQDVTARRETETVLRESEARHRLLIESLAQAVWETDASGVVVADSPSWRAYTGQTLKEWLGYGWLDAIHPDDRRYAERQWREAVTAGGLVNAEFRLRAPGGGWRWTNVRAAPMMDASGHIEKWLGLNIDIDDRKRAEAALRESEEKYRSLFETMGQGYAEMELIRDEEGRTVDLRYLDLNPAYERLTGIPVAEARGRTVLQVLPGFEEWWFAAYDRIVRGGRPERIEYGAPTLDRWYEAHVYPRDDLRFVVLYEDITDRKRTEAALREREERQAFLLRFSDALRAEPDVDAVANRAIRMLADQMDLDRCYITFYRPDDDEAVFPYQVGNDTVPPLPARVRLSDFPEAYEQVGQKTFVIMDDFERRGLSEAERANSKALGMRAMLASTIRRGEKTPLASLMAVSSRPRHWTPGEIALVEEAAERTWAALERARAEATLRESEAKYRNLFETIDSGYALVEVVRDAGGAAIDLVAIEVNESWKATTGLSDPLGRRISELLPNLEDHWLQYYEAVVRTGRPQREENYLRDVDRWFSAHYSPVGDPGSNLVAVVFDDITERKRTEASLRQSEERQAFLLTLADALRPLADPAKVQAAATKLLRERLDAGWCYYVEWNEAGTIARVLQDATREGLSSLTGEHDVSDAPEFLDLLRTGETLNAPDYANFVLLSPRIRGRYAALGFRSMLGLPLVKDGRLVATLLLGDTAIRSWSENDVALARETAERTWAAVERARAEAALRERDERNAFLVRFSDAVRELVDPQAVAQAACRLLAEKLGVERAYWAEVDEGTREYVIGATVHVPGEPVIEGRFPVDAWEPLSSLHRAGLPVVVSDTQADPRLPPEVKEGYVQLSIGADLAVPVLLGGQLRCTLAVNQRSPRHWTPEDVALVRGIAERCWSEVERARAEAALRESEERLRSFGEASSDVLWIRDAKTLEWTYLSPAFESIYGVSREEALRGDTMANWLTLVVPEDRDRAQGEIEKARAGERVTFEYRITRPSDGEVRLLRKTDFPIRDASGQVIRIGGVGHDATDERAAAERLQVLVHELQHRTRNLMGVVQSVTNRTLAGSTSLDDFQGRIRDRLGALARVNGLLSRLNEGDRISFDELIRTELKGHGVIDGQDHGPQVSLRGPKGLRLRSSQVQTLALGLHELATNALKYGALSRPEGRLEISWSLAPGPEGTRRLRVEWRESGVAVAQPDGAEADAAVDGRPPRRRGYGRELIERALPYQLQAETSYQLTPEGVRCTITLPLSSIQGGGGSSPEDKDV